MKFAKLFERDGHQVLALATKNDDELPCLLFIMEIDDMRVEPAFTYKDGEWDKRDMALENADEAMAFSLRDSFVAKFGRAAGSDG